MEASPCGNQTIRWSQLIKLKTQELHVQRLLFETLKDLSTCTTGVHVLYLNSHWVHSTEEKKKRRQWPMCTFFRFWKVSIIFATEINEYKFLTCLQNCFYTERLLPQSLYRYAVHFNYGFVSLWKYAWKNLFVINEMLNKWWGIDWVRFNSLNDNSPHLYPWMHKIWKWKKSCIQ